MTPPKQVLSSSNLMEAWPNDSIEEVASCPACTHENSQEIYKNLVDSTFYCAPGKWSVFVCNDCGSYYLPKRPTAQSIGLAYTNYYTHQANPKNNTDKSRKSQIRLQIRRFFDLYLAKRFGGDDASSKSSALLNIIFWPYKRRIEREYRHLPKCEGVSNRLLDVGCGNGSFLLKVKKFGWQCEGVDFDQKAVEAARLCGIDVHFGGIEVYSDQQEIFDVITASHVIEHLHDPSGFIECCHRLLKPGGQFWLETPNISSESHAIFRQNWRGLEVPRHLVIFNRESLHSVLLKNGFKCVQDLKCPSPSKGMHRASYAIKEGISEQYIVKLGFWQKISLLRAFLTGFFDINKTEFLTIKTTKSKQLD